jgi:putative DNA primase/helicase
VNHPDIFATARAAVNPTLIENFFPGGKWDGDEYWTLNPTRSDKHVGSFSISREGLWKDFSDNSGGDIISLISEVNHISLKEAAEKIIEYAGGHIAEPRPEKKKSEKEPAQVPIPREEKHKLPEMLSSEFYQNRYGVFVKFYPYVSFNGEWQFITARYETPDGSKSVVPFYLGKSGKWINARPPLPKGQNSRCIVWTYCRNIRTCRCSQSRGKVRRHSGAGLHFDIIARGH